MLVDKRRAARASVGWTAAMDDTCSPNAARTPCARSQEGRLARHRGEVEEVQRRHAVSRKAGSIVGGAGADEHSRILARRVVSAPRVRKPRLLLGEEPLRLLQEGVLFCGFVEPQQPPNQEGVVVEEGWHRRSALAPAMSKATIRTNEGLENEGGSGGRRLHEHGHTENEPRAGEAGDGQTRSSR